MADAASIAVRFALYVDLMVLFGVPAFVLLITGAWSGDGIVALRPIVAIAAVVGLALSIAGIALLAASMSGVAVGAVDPAAIRMLVTGTSTGTAWLVRIAALLLALLVAVAARKRQITCVATTLCGGIALATLAWLGHGVMDDGRTGLLHLLADIGHLIAAGIWVGALAALSMMLFQPADSMGAAQLDALHRALKGFAWLGTAAVGLIVATGLINAWLLVGPGSVGSLGTTIYGQLLLVKLALFGAMLLLAALNRFRHVPALGRATGEHKARDEVRALRLSLALETGLAATVLVLVAWLGTLAPPISAM